MKTRVMDLPGWVPQSGGAYDPHTDKFPVAAGEVTIENVHHVMNDHVTFTCIFNGRSVSYDFFVLDAKMAKKIAKILVNNRGKSLLSIGTMEIPADEDQ